MRDEAIDLCGQVNFTRTDAMPLLERDTQFRFACAGCGNCCRGREDIVLSGYDLWRIAARLRLPPQIVARGYCRSSIGRVSHLPVLRLAPVKENRNNCPFLTENHCAIHDAEPLVCALYPLAQEISRAGEVHYFLQPTQCGGLAGRNAPQVKARQHDILSPPAAIPAARAGKRKRLVPPQQRHFAGKIHPPAEIDLTLFEHPGSPHFRFDGPPGPCSFDWTCFQLTALFRKLQPFLSASLRRLTKLLDKLSKKR